MKERCMPTRELHWGITHVTDIKPQKRRFTAFTSINNNLFASSDGQNVYFWNSSGVIKELALPAISLFFIKQNNHIIASVRNSTHLHFIWLHEPYSIVVHPLSFSLKTITSLFYLPKSETLVTAGQGIQFTKMILPKVPEEGGCSQLIELSPIAEIYPDEIFTKVSLPLFIEAEDSVAVSIGRSLFIHSYDGSIIGTMTNLTPGNITCTSYFLDRRLIVVGDEFGNILFVEYGAFYSKIGTNLSNGNHLLMAYLFDRYFLITVSLDKTLTLINMKSEYRLETLNLKSEIITARVEQSIVFVFTNLQVQLFKISIFTNFLANLTANATKIERSLTPGKYAKIICYQKDNLISSFTANQGNKLYEIRSGSLMNELVDFLRDGDDIFLRFQTGNYICMNVKENYEISMVTNTGEDSIKVPPSVINVVQIIKYIDNNSEPCLLSLTSSGHVYAFSVTKKSLINSLYTGNKTLFCGIYSEKLKLFFLSNTNNILIVDMKTLTIKKRVDKGYVTFFYIYEDLLMTGDANGVFEIWELPTVSLLHKSMDFNAAHSVNGIRKQISDYISINEIPFAVKYIDFLKSREIAMSVSNSGEIYLWTLNAFPYAHLDFFHGISSACFYDGNGSILISTFESLLIINYLHLFENEVKINCCFSDNNIDEFNTFDVSGTSIKTRSYLSSNDWKPIDYISERFDRRENSLSTRQKITKIRMDRFEQVENEEKVAILEKKKKRGDLEECDNNEFIENPFVDLIVEEGFIPKRHFVCARFINKNNSDENVRYKIPQKPKISLPETVSYLPQSPSKDDTSIWSKNPRNIKSEPKKAKKKTIKKDTKPSLPTEKKSKPPPTTTQQQQNTVCRKSVRKDSSQSINPNSNQSKKTTFKPNLYNKVRQIVRHPQEKQRTEPVFTVEATVRIEEQSKSKNDIIHHSMFKVQPPSIPKVEIDENPNEKSEVVGILDDANDGKEVVDPNPVLIEEEIKKDEKGNENPLDNSLFSAHAAEFIEPRFDYGKIPNVTMEELDIYMRKNTVFLKDPSNKRRCNSLRRKQSTKTSLLREERNHFLKVSKLPRPQNNKRTYYDSIF